MASFTNVATLSYGGNQVSSNVVTGEIREVLTVSKTAVPAAYAVGDTKMCIRDRLYNEGQTDGMVYSIIEEGNDYFAGSYHEKSGHLCSKQDFYAERYDT